MGGCREHPHHVQWRDSGVVSICLRCVLLSVTRSHCHIPARDKREKEHLFFVFFFNLSQPACLLGTKSIIIFPCVH